jgi:predicted dithiol-disulfide oxidoreductase (DUF899 family)
MQCAARSKLGVIDHMIQDNIAHPPIASREEWLAQRLELLAHEKELTRHYDRVNAERRRLPMVKLEKTYTFQAPEGQISLLELFQGQRQLIVYHFMFDPEWEKGCSGCTEYVDAIADLSMLAQKSATFVLISRAPLAKLEAYRREKGWTQRWVSSFNSDFNYDFHATHDENVAPVEYNYMSKEQLEARRGVGKVKGEDHGLSVFFRLGDEVFHTYSTYARVTENLTDTYRLLDVTPFGRQQDFEDSPPGWPQQPTYG